ncbi:MAG TPA: hypothetical protein VFS43_23095 [Polyangiaceae bacterium]|nr:hypothetical protein [Polyangiaceae bacterium]
MADSFVIVCLLLIAGLAGLGWWALKLDAERQVLAQQVAGLVRQLGDVERRAEHLRAFSNEVKRLEAECNQLALRRAKASQEFNAYARDLALRREAAERDFREQCEADARALEAYKATLAQKRLELEHQFGAAAAQNDWREVTEARATTADEWQAVTEVDFSDLRRRDERDAATVAAVRGRTLKPPALAESGAYLVSDRAAAS